MTDVHEAIAQQTERDCDELFKALCKLTRMTANLLTKLRYCPPTNLAPLAEADLLIQKLVKEKRAWIIEVNP